MLKSTEGVALLLITFLCLNLTAQTSSYHANRILVSFKSGVSESSKTNLQNAYSASEVYRFPDSDIRVWEIASFPVNYSYLGQNTTLLNINTVNQSARQNAEVESVEYDYLMEFNVNKSNDDIQNPGTSYDCNGSFNITEMSGNFPTKLSIIDTGFSPNDTDDGTSYFFNIEQHAGYNYVANSSNYNDDNDHGTHIASIVNHVSHSAASVDPLNSYTQYQMQKAFDANGNAYLSDVIEAIGESIANGINILNFSFSYRAPEPVGYPTPMQRVLAAAENANILIIAAAGNDYGVDNDQANIKNYPASFDYPNILSVASVSCDGSLSAFSNYGATTIDIAAPGEYIEGAGVDSEIALLSGTSQASAIISGVANMLASHMSSFDYAQVKCAILSSAQSSDALQGKVLSNGIVDAEAALNMLYNCSTSGEAPVLGLTSRSSSKSNFSTDFAAYPNPAQAISHVQFNADSNEPVAYRLIDMTGRIVLNGTTQTSLGQNVITLENLNTLQNGVYVIQVQNSTLELQQKINVLN